jgi:hypothetical protein
MCLIVRDSVADYRDWGTAARRFLREHVPPRHARRLAGREEICQELLNRQIVLATSREYSAREASLSFLAILAVAKAAMRDEWRHERRLQAGWNPAALTKDRPSRAILCDPRGNKRKGAESL